MILKKKLIILDLDGVILDSKNNMKFAWNKTNKKFNLNVNFERYFENIGLPFHEILIKLKIKPSKRISNFFKQASIEKINLIKLYKTVKNFINLLERKKIQYSIVTSKDLFRTKLFLKKFKIKPLSIHCPNKKLRGKPYPDHLIKVLKKNHIIKDDACYVGDTMVDYLAAKNAKISFIFAKYGYGKNSKLYKNKISKFSDLKKYIDI